MELAYLQDITLKLEDDWTDKIDDNSCWIVERVVETNFEKMKNILNVSTGIYKLPNREGACNYVSDDHQHI